MTPPTASPVGTMPPTNTTNGVRITENSVIGTYEYTRNGYQQQKLTTNEAGETYLEKTPTTHCKV